MLFYVVSNNGVQCKLTKDSHGTVTDMDIPQDQTQGRGRPCGIDSLTSEYVHIRGN